MFGYVKTDTPNTYVKEKIEEESITIEEIDSELEKLYAQLGIKK